MSAEVKKEIELEIAYVLFVDIVGYSKLLIDQQRRSLELLNQIVRGTEQFRKADAPPWPLYARDGLIDAIPHTDLGRLVIAHDDRGRLERRRQEC